MAVYVLPDLPYAYDALEPHISAEIMELHHSKHHQAYVDGANAALAALEAAREAGDLAAINLHEKNLAFHLGGHSNHSVFWKNMTPEAKAGPEGALKDAIDKSFGSLDNFKKQFTAAAMGLQGSGWAVLAYDTISGGLVTFQLYDQQGNVPVGTVPLLMLDMWEHAFYLDYKNVKAKYVEAWWNVVNWDDVEARYDRATANFGSLLS
ncbi:superoxide dismutase [Actinomycetaceae bacterium WB03_NA08]|uniref:Superoxide dismutase n=1 Tax=Scrofimicrobium canadense TaxID=2652290 RepID=A0A6N7W7Q0_9ACTO|nr:superoxide dismutase [Scrofimicrobium canadense]MSS84462.1 superoxide dismutase [Scrofimicrobium canadense]